MTTIFSMNSKYLIFLLLILPTSLWAQLGGENTYEFLNLPNSARMAALGGNQVALTDETDLNVSYNNPALLREEMQNHLIANYVNYVSDVNYGYVAYALAVKWPVNLALGMQYINYGTFVEAMPDGLKPGNTFSAAEYAMNIICSYQLNQFSVGATIKPVWSSFETYQSAGLAADFGVSYHSKDELMTVALVAKNIGRQLTTYYDGADREPLPFDLQLGFSQRLGHAPIRIAATLQHLQKWELSKPRAESNGYITTLKEDGFGKQFLRHLLIGVELLPSENFILRVGYNYQRRQELKFDEKMSTVGFCFGLGFKVSRFHLNYGLARYHLAGASNHLSVSVNLNDGYRKRR